MWRRLGEFLAIALSITTATTLAQTPQFRAGVDIVHLDVSVYDHAGNPVRGLTAADFTLLEDDKPRPIVAFSAVDIPPAGTRSSSFIRVHQVPGA
jgi:hypothetical protein